MKTRGPNVRWFVALFLFFFSNWGLFSAQAQVLTSPQTSSPNQALGMRYPALSADGKQLAFSYHGDIWLVPSKGGTARRLTIHPAYDFAPRWSPDGRLLLFTSKRSGNEDLYILTLSNGKIRRLTYHNAYDFGLGWSQDGQTIYFASRRENPTSIYSLAIHGGTPKRLINGFWNMVGLAAPSPNGRFLLVSPGSEGYYFWWRKGYKGSNNSDIYLYDILAKKATQLTHNPYNDRWAMWAPDGQHIYFVSERNDTANLWSLSLKKGQPQAITHFKKGPIRWPSISRNTGLIVYERDFQIWLTDPQKGNSHPIPIHFAAVPSKERFVWKKLNKIDEFQISPDGKKVAFVMHGEIFVSDTAGKTIVKRATHTIWREFQIQWMKDSRHIIFVADRGKGPSLYKLDLLEGKEELIYRSSSPIWNPRLSPKNNYLLFIEGKDKLMLTRWSQKPHLLLKAELGGFMSIAPQWSKDERWILFTTFEHGRETLWLKQLPKGQLLRLTLGGVTGADAFFSKDSRFIFFRSNRYGSDWFTDVGDDDLYVLPLQHQKPQFKEDAFEKLFKVKKKGRKTKKNSALISQKIQKTKKKQPTSKKTKEAKKAKKTKEKHLKIDTKDLQERLIRLTRLKGHDHFPKLAPNGKHLLFFSNAMGRYHLYLAKFDSKKIRLLNIKRIAKNLSYSHAWEDQGLQWGPKSKKAYILRYGKLYQISIPSGKTRRLAFNYSMKIDQHALFLVSFREVWTTLKDSFYDPSMHGTDWKAIYRKYRPVIAQMQSEEEWKDLMNEMLGELNASHLGVRNARHRPPYFTGTLGLDLRPTPQGLLIQRIVKNGAFYNAYPNAKSGALLIAIDGKKLSPQDNLYRYLRNKMNKRTLLTLLDPKTKKKKVYKIKPEHYRKERWMRYLAWVQQRRKWVQKWSHGQIGYLHIRYMSKNELLRFIREFESHVAHKKASIIDIRFNWGGNVHDRLLQILSRRLYSRWQIRGMKSWGQPFFAMAHKPMVMLINEESLSDAEVTANGFKALKLGTLIGTPTYHWIIFTTSMSLMGGRSFRLPFWACFTKNGLDLEKIGVTPDIFVKNTFSDRLHNRDPQLKKAVQFLLKKLQK